jgi:predicted amidohydrolase YtcJ
MNRRFFLLASTAACAAAPALAAAEGFLVYGGHIGFGGDPHGGEPPEAFLLRKGRLPTFGALDDLRRQAGGVREIDLKGGFAYRGFVDNHVHLTGVGLREMTLNLDRATSVADLIAATRVWHDANPGTDPLAGRGWIETHWPEKRFPNRADLDEISTTRPIVLERADGHALVVNSAGLRLAGIDASTPDPAGGRIERDASGEPTGMLIDNAMNLIGAKLPPLSYARRKEALAKGTQLYAARGWTGGVNMSTEAADVKALFELAAEGRLPIRVDVFMTPEDSGEVLKRGPYADKTGLVRVRGVKLYMDGALGSRGAALLKPYSDRPDTSGLLIAEHDATLAMLRQALKVRAQVAIHAIGDRGNRLALDWIEEAFTADPVAAKAVTWRIEHAQIIDPADIPRFAKLGVVASMQPSHAIGDLYFAPARLGPDRLAGAYAWRSLIVGGATVVGGSDAPVEVGDPRIELYAAIARKDLQGRSGPDWNPKEALTARPFALGLFSGASDTVDDASRELRGDITVFSKDVLTIPEAEILTVKPLLTIVGGRIVHDER